MRRAARSRSGARSIERDRDEIRFMIDTSERCRLGGVIGSGE
jgi:hypothetical protein